MQRTSCLRGRLASKPFDVVVIGGGVHGVAIARHCALAGQRTLLLEQHDFGSGTASRASRIVGDVFGELERGEIAMARDALRERDCLLMERGHLVSPMPGLVALGHERRRSALEVRFGLWLRRRLSHPGATSVPDSQIRDLKALLGGESTCAVLPFDDAICQFPERLLAEWLREAGAAGAVCRNYCRVLRIDTANGAVRGVTTRDLLSEQEEFLPARWVINATGVAADELCQESNLGTRRLACPVRNIHLVLRRFPGAPEAVVYGEGVDGREVAMMPWNDRLLLSAMRKDPLASAHAAPASHEIEYLQHSLRKLFPAADPEILAAFGGSAAVPAERGFASRLLRNRSLVVDHDDEGAHGLLTVIGGSLTTAFPAARECAARIGFCLRENPICEYLPGRSNGMKIALAHWSQTVAVFARIAPSTAQAIASWHGREALGIARLACGRPEMREQLCPHSEHIVAEAVNAVRCEHAVFLSDILLRRVPVALSSCWSELCTRTAAERVARALGWSDQVTADQVAALESERNAFFVKAPVVAPVRVFPDTLAA